MLWHLYKPAQILGRISKKHGTHGLIFNEGVEVCCILCKLTALLFTFLRNSMHTENNFRLQFTDLV